MTGNPPSGSPATSNVYDYDIVDQGVGTINRLAQEIGRAGSWYFWWD
jgi:uncharacterized protein DUF4253